MDRLPNLVGGAPLIRIWDFAAVHPFLAAWIALTTAWTLFTFARRDGA